MGVPSIDGLGPIPVTEARLLMGECILKAVVTNGVAVANVTHLGRGPTVAQKIAMLWSTPSCSREGCNRTVVQYDHRIDWRFPRHTRLDETDPLCTHDHDNKTLHGWALVEGSGRRPMVPPGHPQHPGTPAELAARQAMLFEDTG